jgi:hypothetical protein
MYNMSNRHSLVDLLNDPVYHIRILTVEECCVQISMNALKLLKYITVFVKRSCEELLCAVHDANFCCESIVNT